jgi:DNA-binding response OmpR family regulator
MVVDDDKQTCLMLSYVLQESGHGVEMRTSSADVIDLVRRGGIDLLILDVSILPVDGFTLLEQLQRSGACPPVVFLSGHDEREARLRAFELGALDYMIKPVDIGELAARVRIAMQRGRRLRGIAAPDTAGLTLHEEAGTVGKPDGTTVRLTPLEARLLKVLLAHRDTVLSRDDLLNAVWGLDYEGDGNVVEVYIRRLRRKIEADPGNPSYLHTVREMGYAFSPNFSEAAVAV